MMAYGSLAQWGAEIARPALFFSAMLAALLAVRRLVLRRLYRRAPNHQSVGYISLETLRMPSMLWCIAAALSFALQYSEVPDKYTDRAAKVIVVFLVLSLCLVLASLLVRVSSAYGQRRGVPFATSGLAQTLVRVPVFLIGVLFVLKNVFDKDITAMLAALGVGGVAIALALQDTLANFFAGIHILVEEPISVGHAIRLTENEEGFVTDIGWRTTRIRTGRNTIVVVPNTKITSGILTNYTLPDPRIVVEVPVMVSHEADADQATRAALEEARATAGVLPDPAPRIFFLPGFLATHLEFRVVFSVPDFTHQAVVGSEVRLRIARRLRAEGVAMPKTEPRA